MAGLTPTGLTAADPTPALCRDCAAALPCRCGGGRIVRHAALFRLTIAHVDCDAFYASVEKRDRPDLAAQPVIVGGGTRGVVTAACYVARLYGVRSAMPMFKALAACPDAVVIRPDFAKYSAVARQMRAMMERLTPLVQPLSIDEAVLDLAGTEALHGAPAAVVLARFALDVERTLGLTVSIGLAANRMVAKIAADRDKPRGFAVLGAEAADALAGEPVGLLPGIGPAAVRRLAALGLTRIGQLQALGPQEARRRLGEDGPGLVARARCEDARPVDPVRSARSISAETTLEHDLADAAALEAPLWRMAEKLARRLTETDAAAAGVVLKLKTASFASRTRTIRLPQPTRLPDVLFDHARQMLAREADGTTRFRLIGIGAAPLAPPDAADRGDLADPLAARRVATQAAIDRLRARYGAGVIGRGRGLAGKP